ncbi:hypothetical protein DSECCO2_460560 [anaerobic digester metagenome]
METALRYELNANILDIKDKIYPTNAPEGSTGPYLVYTRISTKPIKTLEGYTNKEATSYMFSIMAVKYSDMIRIRKQVKELLVGMAQREIGSLTKFFVEDIDINNIDETWENELGVNRGIIDFTIYY